MTSLTCVQVSQYIAWSIPTHDVDTQTLVIDDTINLCTGITVHRTVHTYTHHVDTQTLFVVTDDIINQCTGVTIHHTVHTYP